MITTNGLPCEQVSREYPFTTNRSNRCIRCTQITANVNCTLITLLNFNGRRFAMRFNGFQVGPNVSNSTIRTLSLVILALNIFEHRSNINFRRTSLQNNLRPLNRWYSNHQVSIVSNLTRHFSTHRHLYNFQINHHLNKISNNPLPITTHFTREFRSAPSCNFTQYTGSSVSSIVITNKSVTNVHVTRCNHAVTRSRGGQARKYLFRLVCHRHTYRH